LRFSANDLAFLAQAGGFEAPYLEFLRTIELTEIEVTAADGSLHIRTGGQWCRATFWETLVLAVVNALYVRGRMREEGLTESDLDRVGREHLGGKIKRLLRRPGASIIEFGTRRRRNERWHYEVTATLMEQVGNQLQGTSNLYLAMVLGLPEPMPMRW
jgi:nicotinate phosphoribosyltransferase